MKLEDLSDETISLLKDLNEDEIKKMLKDRKLKQLREDYKNEPRIPLCIRMNKKLYEKVCDFCNKQGDYKDIKNYSTLSGMIETITELFLTDNASFDRYFECYNANIPSNENVQKIVGKKRKEK